MVRPAARARTPISRRSCRGRAPLRSRRGAIRGTSIGSAAIRVSTSRRLRWAAARTAPDFARRQLTRPWTRRSARRLRRARCG